MVNCIQCGVECERRTTQYSYIDLCDKCLAKKFAEEEYNFKELK